MATRPFLAALSLKNSPSINTSTSLAQTLNKKDNESKEDYNRNRDSNSNNDDQERYNNNKDKHIKLFRWKQ